MKVIQQDLRVITLLDAGLEPPEFMREENFGAQMKDFGYRKIVEINVGNELLGVCIEAFENHNGTQGNENFTFILQVDFGTNVYEFCTENVFVLMKFIGELIRNSEKAFAKEAA